MRIRKTTAAGLVGTATVAVAMTLASAPTAMANASANYSIHCWTSIIFDSNWRIIQYGECVEYSNGTMTHFGYDDQGGYWIISSQ